MKWFCERGEKRKKSQDDLKNSPLISWIINGTRNRFPTTAKNIPEMGSTLYSLEAKDAIASLCSLYYRVDQNGRSSIQIPTQRANAPRGEQQPTSTSQLSLDEPALARWASSRSMNKLLLDELASAHRASIGSASQHQLGDPAWAGSSGRASSYGMSSARLWRAEAS